MSILNYFPLSQMRDRQKSVLEEIESSLKSGYKHIFLEAPTGFGKCLKPDQMVFTKEGLVRIKEIKQGSRLTRSYALCDSVNMGKKKVVTIITKHGYTLSGAEEHMILAYSEGKYTWKMLKDISHNDFAVIDYSGLEFTNDDVPVDFIESCGSNNGRGTINLPIYWTEDLAYLVGIYVAKGSVGKNPAVIDVMVNDGKSAHYAYERVCRISKSLGIDCTWQRDDAFRFNSLGLSDFLRSLCSAIDAQDKYIPDAIYKLPRKIVINFIKGLYDGGGQSSRQQQQHIEFKSASKRLCHDLQLLLLSLGITSTLSERYVTQSPKNPFATSTELRISGDFMVTRFINTLGSCENDRIFVNEPKAKNGGMLLKTDNQRQLEEVSIKHSCELCCVTGSSGGSQTLEKVSHPTEPSENMDEMRAPSNRQLHSLVGALGIANFVQEYDTGISIAKITQNNFLHSSVKQIIRENTECELFDFEAQPTHEYVAQGFVNHNSPVAIAVARYLGSSHICTATKDLQTQYSRDFPFVQSIKGKGNFPCIVKEEMGLDESCEYGPCVKDDSYDCLYKTRLSDYKVIGEGTPKEIIELDPYAERRYIDKVKSHSRLLELEWKPCHYYHQKWMGVKSSHTIYNYRYFLSDIFYSGTIQKRKLLALDEAHTLESEITDFRSFTIYKGSFRFLPKLQIPDRRGKEYDVETWAEFGSFLDEKLNDFIEQAAEAIERNRAVEPFTERNLIDAISRQKTLSDVLDDIKSNKGNWIVSNADRDAGTGQLQRITLTPLDVSGYFDTILDKGTISFLMSATILSKDYLCKTVGIKPDEVKFVRVSDSDFPIKNRPIYLMNVAWLNAKTMNESLPKIARAVDNIMSMHKNEKGIVHTTSYTQLDFIKNNLGKENTSRLIETGPKLDRSKLLERHSVSGKPTVLISPSLHLGVDLKDDLSRFQIIVKVPYPDLTDRKISAMKQRNPEWYTWNTVLKLIQTYGRSIRSKDDFARTYILDGNITYLLKNAEAMIPKWFKEAVIQKGSLT